MPIEAELTAHVVHTNLVRTIDTASAYRDTAPKLDWEIGHDKAKEEEAAKEGEGNEHAASTSGQPPAPVEETWLLLEYCDQGTLIVRPYPISLLSLCVCGVGYTICARRESHKYSPQKLGCLVCRHTSWCN